jgi:hypothetical protein
VSPGRAAPSVTVIVPTHDHASTLDLAVTSVLRQSIDALDVVIIGDGVADDTRDVVSPLLSDQRVRFLDHPKSPSRCELVRHEVLRAAHTPYVCYLGDDDLMLADHVETTVARLQLVDFTHPLPAFIARDGSLDVLLTDIAESRSRDWHLEPEQNSISLTGVGHRLDAYLALPHGWREPPPGTWSDHYMWQQWFAAPSMRFSTGDRLTVLKFYAAARKDMAADERRKELLEWIDKSTQPGFENALSAEAGAAVRRMALAFSLELEFAQRQLADANDAVALERTHHKATHELLDAHAAAAKVSAAQAEEAQTTVQELQNSLEEVRRTRTWRLHDRLARLSIVRRFTQR